MKEPSCIAKVTHVMFSWVSKKESVGKIWQIVANVIVIVPQMKDVKNKKRMNLCIIKSLLICLLITVVLEKTRPISKAVQAAISIVEETRIADANAEGLSILNIMFPPMPNCHYIIA